MPSVTSPSQKENVNHSVCVLGAPLSHGQTLSGVSKAPNVLRECGLFEVIEKLGWKSFDAGDVQPIRSGGCSIGKRPPIRSIPESVYTEKDIPKCKTIGEACGMIAEATHKASQKGEFVLTIGGDHSVAAGSVAGGWCVVLSV